ncbi:hypothetical protein OCA08_17285 [Bacillus cereus]|nr:hypothetical protein [Bacillus cereus]
MANFCTKCGKEKNSPTDKVCTRCRHFFDEVEKDTVKPTVPLEHTKKTSETENVEVEKKESLQPHTVGQKVSEKLGEINNQESIKRERARNINDESSSSQVRKNKKWIWMAVSAVVLACAGGGTYVYGKQQFSQERVIEQVSGAIKTQNAEEFNKMVKFQPTKQALSMGDTEKFLKDVHSSMDIQTQLLKSLEEQKNENIQNEKKNAYIIRVEKSNDKNLLVFDKYEVYLVPSSLSFEIPKNANLTVDKKKVDVSNGGKVNLDMLIPGVHNINVSNEKDEVSETIETWKPENGYKVIKLDSDSDQYQDNYRLGKTKPSENAAGEVSRNLMEGFMVSFIEASVQTFNSRDMIYVFSLMDNNGSLQKETEEYVKYLQKKGITETWLGTELLDMKKVDNSTYHVTVNSKFNIIYDNGATVKFKSFKSSYVVKYIDSELLVNKIIKEDLLEERQVR